MNTDIEALEKTGPNFSVDAMMTARRKTKEAISQIAEGVKPGMLEEEARRIANRTLERLGSAKRWHKTLIRFGSNTTKNFVEPSDLGVRLLDDDIFFVDIGPIWEGTEGDGGDTLVVGKNPDPEMQRCADAARQIFGIVRNQWMSSGMNGKELYKFAVKATADLGWVLNLGLTGHRLSEFPHSTYYNGTLGAVPIRPSPNLWILEIQIRHPFKPIGGFFEDLLITDQHND
jgi:Xaa-Pro aminopeptidase